MFVCDTNPGFTPQICKHFLANKGAKKFLNISNIILAHKKGKIFQILYANGEFQNPNTK